MSIDYAAARARIIQAGEVLGVDVTPILAFSDEQMNEGIGAIEMIAHLLPGQSLDWLFLGDHAPMIRNRAKAKPVSEIGIRLMDAANCREPLPEALALARVLDAAARGDLPASTDCGDTLATVAYMIAVRVAAGLAEIDAIRVASERGLQA